MEKDSTETHSCTSEEAESLVRIKELAECFIGTITKACKNSVLGGTGRNVSMVRTGDSIVIVGIAQLQEDVMFEVLTNGGVVGNLLMSEMTL